MANFFKILYICFFIFVPVCLFGYQDCSRFQYDVDVNVNNITKDTVKISSSKEKLLGKLGYTESKISYEYKLFLIPVRVFGGYCISLRGLDVDVFFPEFNIVIDKRLKPNTCAYNVVLNHEQDHVNAHKKVLNENINDVKSALVDAVKSIKPVFIKKHDNQDNIQEEIIKKIENYKSVVKIQEEVSKSLEEENEKIDTRGDDYQVWKCKDFYEEMVKSGENIRID